MSLPGILQVLLYVALLVAITRPMGAHLARVFADPGPGQRNFLSPVLGPLERLIYRLTAVNPEAEQGWVGYTFALLLFSLAGALVTYGIERLQNLLPFNPQGLDAVPPDLAFNTAVSFTTNTNWQNYAGEATMSYFTQMAALAFHNWVSAAAGIAIAVALTRGLARRSGRSLGNFWVDVVRCTLYVLLPICFIYTLFLVWQGVPQNLNEYTSATTLEGATQTIAQGPVASQEAIKMLGTNGGGFFNANSAHPFENPTPLSNFVEILSIFSIGAGLTYMFGRMVGDTRQGWALFAAMLVLFVAGRRGSPARRAGRQSSADAAGHRPDTLKSPDWRQLRGQRNPLRPVGLGVVRGHHDRCVVRSGQRHARQPDADRGHDPDAEHPAR